ncbi:MAG: type VI secretion system contractile sheath large subunit [Planctomycetia bacterium]|nr:type VI secretion system contractile sheath large subunit [Planctomycetia bacterium]
MQTTLSFGTLASDQKVGADLPKDDTPFRIAVLGDFSGRAARGAAGSSEEIGRRRARKVDRANLDDLIARTAPALELDLGAAGGTVALSFRSLDDFHPDAIHARVAAFADAFDRNEKAALMNAILHHPAVQSLESAWRGVDWLLQGVARAGAVEVRLIDLTADELAADLASSERLEETGLYQILVDQPASRGDLDPWSVLVGLYLFEPTAAHAGVLGRVGRIARQASAPFLSGVDPRVLTPSFAPEEADAEAWGLLRQLPESSLLGLVAPRFLLRPPYGEATRTIDAFEYEEYTGPSGWGGYLWGSSALACAALLARSFAKDGWAFRPGSVLDLGGMGMHVTRDEDDEPISVLAEARLVRPSAERLTGLGLMPLLCVKGRDAAELADVRSLARPPKGETASPLLGRWGQKGTVTLPRSGDAPKVSVAAAMSVAPPPPSAQAVTQAPAEPVEEIDPELAALMGDLDTPGPVETPAEDLVDPELAALMSELDAPEPAEPAAEEMDPELAALMAELSDTPEPTAEANDEEMDPELAALMAGLDDDPGPTAGPADEEMDPELAALMAELDAPEPDPKAT